MTPSEPGRELADARSLGSDENLRVARTVLDPDSGRCGCGGLDGRTDLRRLELARPDVRERHPERRQRGGEAVGHGQGEEVPVRRVRVDRHLPAGNMLLDEERRDSGCVQRHPDRLTDLGRRPDERQPALALPVRRLDHARKADAPRGLRGLTGAGADLVGGLLDAPTVKDAIAVLQLKLNRMLFFE